MAYVCIYCEELITDTGTCRECSVRIDSVKQNPKAFFNILGVLADDKGFELNLSSGINGTTYDEWMC